MDYSPSNLLKRVKICGLTRPADVQLCCRLGADLLGFVVAPSPRQISLDTVKLLSADLPSNVLTVAVVVNPSQSEADKLLEVVDRVQFHGQETPEFCRRYGGRAIKAFRIRGADDLDTVEQYRGCVGGLLLDSYQKGVAGGTGHSFTWSVLQRRKFFAPTLLAGGLEVGNLPQAWNVEAVDGFDLSSGVEESPGCKDPAKLKDFFALLERLRGQSSCKH